MGASSRSDPKATGTFELTTGSVEETQALGERLGRLLRVGDVVALCGELGSGKTTLIQGLAQGLGIDPGVVKSPTFVLVREYNGPVPLVHIDGYRLDGPNAAASLDVELLFSPLKIAVVEWAQRFEGLLPAETVTLELEHVSANRRRVRLVPSGARSREVMQGLEGAREDARN